MATVEPTTLATGNFPTSTVQNGVRRTPLYLAERGEPLLAWLHAPAEGRTYDHAVVLCSSIGFEQLHSDRSLRHLADALARKRLPTLRFAWHGTGDSAGDDADADRLTAWTDGLRQAVDFVRTTLGVGRVSLVGLRVGAAIAARAMQELGEIDQFVLWSPVAGGRSFVRQMQTIDRTAELRPTPAEAKEGDIEAAGFFLSEATGGELQQLDLQQTTFSCRRALLVAPYDRRLPGRLVQLGIAVDESNASGYAEMMAEPHFSIVPQQAVAEIATWLHAGAASSAAAEAEFAAESFDAGPATVTVRHVGTTRTCEPVQIDEQPLFFGGELNLFGIVSEPTTVATPTVEPAAAANDRPTILLLNAGAASHVGPGRLNVELARHLSSLGFRCFRMDACGLGESVPHDASKENYPYPPTVFRDVSLAADCLRERYGAERFVVVGLCSGAYAAFQSVVQLPNPEVIGAVLINPVTFFWQDGMTFDAAAAAKAFEEHCRMTRAWNPRKLWRFLRGQTKIGYAEAAALVCRRVGRVVARALPWNMRTPQATSVAELGHPAVDDLQADLLRFLATERKLSLFLADTDPGLTIMKYHAPRETKRMLHDGRLEVVTLRGADHTFSRRAPRCELLQRLGEHLLQKYSPSPTPAR